MADLDLDLEKELGLEFDVPAEAEEQSKPKSSLVKNLENLMQTGADTGSGVAQGATMGFADELKAAAAVTPEFVPAIGQYLDDGGIVDSSSLIKRYQQERDANRAAYAAAKERSPIATTIGELGGGVATGALTAGSGALPLMATGAAAGLGSSEADLAEGQLGQAAADTAMGAGTGLLLGKLGATAMGGNNINAGATTAARTALGGGLGAALAPSENRIEGAAAGAIAANTIPALGSKVIKTLGKTKFGKSVGLAIEEGLAGRGLLGEEAEARANQEMIKAADEAYTTLKFRQDEVGAELGAVRKELADQGFKFNDDSTLVELMTEIETAPLSANEQAKAEKTLNKLLKIIGEKSSTPESMVPSATKTLYEAGMGEERSLLGKLLQKARGQIAEGETKAATEFVENTPRQLGEEVDLSSRLKTSKAGYSETSDAIETLGEGEKATDFVEGMISPNKASGYQAIEEFKTKLTNQLGAEKAKPLTERMEKASRLGEVSKSYLKDPELSLAGGKLYGIAKATPARIANIGAQAYTTLSPQSLAKRAMNLNPLGVKDLISRINEKVPAAAAITNRISEGLTQGDGVKRNAAMFMLMQNPEYRNILNDFLNETGNTDEE